MYGYLEKGIQIPVVQGRSTHSMIKWTRTSRLSIKISLSLPTPFLTEQLLYHLELLCKAERAVLQVLQVLNAPNIGKHFALP